MRMRLCRVLLEVNVMLLGGLNRGDIEELERCLELAGAGSACKLASRGCLMGRSAWVVACVVSMVRARMELEGRKAGPAALGGVRVGGAEG